MASSSRGRRHWLLLAALYLLIASSVLHVSFAAKTKPRTFGEKQVASVSSSTTTTVTRFDQEAKSTSRNGLYILVATGKIGDNVRVCLRSLAVNAPGTSVILVADKPMWTHLRKEIVAGVQGLRLVVLDYDRIVATHDQPFYEVASARFFCVAHALEEVLRGPGTHYVESAFAYYNASSLSTGNDKERGIPRDIGAVLTSDTRDVTFQRDPFAQFWFERDKAQRSSSPPRGIFVISEEAPRPVTRCRVNQEWVDRCFGVRVAPVLGNVYCSGSFMGSPLVFLAFLRDAMVPAMRACKSPIDGFDQGVFNTLAHFPYYAQRHKEGDLLKNAFSDKNAHEAYTVARDFFTKVNPHVVISTFVSGWMTTMGGSFFDEEKQRIMSRNGSTPRACALCHRFDRDKALVRRFDAQFHEPLNTALPQCSVWDKDPYGLGDSCLFPSQDEALHKQVRAVTHLHQQTNTQSAGEQTQTQEKEQRLPLCIGVLAYQGHRTLNNTLSSYAKNGLFNLVQESVLLFQKIDSSARKAYAKHFIDKYPQFTLPPIIETNNTVFHAFGRIARTCTAPYVMVLEEDFALYVEDTEEIVEELLAAIYLIEHRNMSAVRMRRRARMGEPDYLLNHVKKGGRLSPSHLFSQVAWQNNAEDDVSEDVLRVCLRAPKAWCSTSFNADYTNNPTLYRTSFLRELMTLPTGDVKDHVHKFETELINAWRPKRYGVAWASGLFTHDRLDREMKLPKH